MPRPSFTPENAVQLADALMAGILDTGFNALSKNDFYDFVLYLLDTYSGEHFLSRQSIQENALRLKVSPAKIKNSKLNIYLKFVKPEQQQKALTDFIRRIADGSIALAEEGSGSLRFTVDDPVVRFCLDAKMKVMLGKSPDFRLNPEILVMEQADFYNQLRIIIRDNPDFQAIDKETLLQQFDRSEAHDKVLAMADLFLDGAAETVGSLPIPLPVETIKRICKILLKKTTERSKK
jgi:hypothetical protein